jgi:hypothetical protein
MLTLTYGRKRPDNGDKGAIWFPALYYNITRDDAHDHDGVDSASLSSANLARSQQTLLAANWVAQGNGLHKQTVTVPSGYSFDTAQMRFTIASGTESGAITHPTAKRLTAATYDVFTNDSSVDYDVDYL